MCLQLLSPLAKEDCNYIRCLGLNYMEHAKVIIFLAVTLLCC
jgi:hypothetical protein